MTSPDRLAVFALDGSGGYGERVASALGTPSSRWEERLFEDGERKVRPLESVRGRDVFVIDSLYGDSGGSVHDKLCRLLFFAATVRDASAGQVTVVVPYLCYARKDRRTKPRDPIATRYVAQLLEAVGVDRVVTVDVHNPAALQNSFRCRTEHLTAVPLFVDHVVMRLADRQPVVVSPDAGGVKRAEHLRTLLRARLGVDVPLAFVEKHRSGGVVSGGAVVGSVDGHVAIIVDDMISTGTTILRAALSCRDRGAVGVLALATHAVFSTGAADAVTDPGFEEVIVTDTVPGPLATIDPTQRLVVLDSSTLLAEAIDRLHTDRSLVELSDVDDGATAGH